MGQFHFQIPDCLELKPQHLKTLHVIGLDGIPKPCNVKLLNDLVVITRNQNESGKIYISFPFESYGDLTVCTGTLPESDQQYQLCRELARGTLSRLRNQTSIWGEGGLEIPDEVAEKTELATQAFGSSIVEDDGSDQLAIQAMHHAMDAIFILSKKFGKDISKYRVGETEIPKFWFAVPAASSLGQDEKFDACFELLTNESGAVEMKSQNHKQILGPVFDASPMSKFTNHQADYQERRRLLLQRCDEEMNRLNRNTSLIHVACGLNGMGHRDLGYRQQVQLTIDVLEVFSQSQIQTPVCVSFDYPWAERLAWSVGGIHPMHIADELLRNGATISYLGLEINLDYYPVGSLSRDPLQWIELVDSWCQFGLPLILCLRVPQSVRVKDLTGRDVPVEYSSDSGNITTIKATESSSKAPVASNSIRENLNDKQRFDLIETVLPMMIARPGVHGIVWRSRTDLDDSRYPNSGLMDCECRTKPTFDLIKNFRQSILDS